jgi:hypothetical protein
VGCLFIVLLALSPRLALGLMWIVTPWVDRAFGTIIWPILGIIFFPLGTIMYVLFWNTGSHGVSGWEWILVVGAAFVDMASHAAGVAKRREAAYWNR